VREGFQFIPEPVEVPEGAAAVLAKVVLLLLDVDGVLTDGRLFFDGEGRESKVFHVHDGSGLAHWRRSGFATGLLSGRDSTAVRARAAELGIRELHLGVRDKSARLDEILQSLGLDETEVCYVGDDLLDLPVLRRVGAPISVPQARPEVREAALYVTRAPAGGGAVREVVELLLRAKGLYGSVVDACGRPGGPGEGS